MPTAKSRLTNHKKISRSQEGTTQVEKELDFNSADPVVLNISGPRGNYTLEAKEDGYWLANLKSDTVVRQLQHTGKSSTYPDYPGKLKTQLDSLNKLVKGTNVSPQRKELFYSSG